jgi:hypothetical protein
MKKIVYLVLIMMIHSFGYSQNMDWKSLIKEVNGPVSWLTVYNEKLVVGGDFTKGGNVSVSGIASWNGSDWDLIPGAAVDLAVDSQNIVWAVNAQGGIFRNVNSRTNGNIFKKGDPWTQVAGCAKKIAVGGDKTWV